MIQKANIKIATPPTIPPTIPNIASVDRDSPPPLSYATLILLFVLIVEYVVRALTDRVDFDFFADALEVVERLLRISLSVVGIFFTEKLQNFLICHRWGSNPRVSTTLGLKSNPFDHSGTVTFNSGPNQSFWIISLPLAQSFWTMSLSTTSYWCPSLRTSENQTSENQTSKNQTSPRKSSEVLASPSLNALWRLHVLRVDKRGEHW